MIEVTPDESDPIYNMPKGTIESLDSVEDPTTYIENDVENKDSELRGHAGTLVPWENDETINEAITREFNAVTTAIGPNLVFRSRACRKPNLGELPIRTFDGPNTLNGYIQIDGVKARVLIDTGCTTDMISPNVLGALDKLPFELSEPVGL